MYFPVSLGDTVTEADKLLYQILLRHDYIYYYLYKLNFAKIARYEAELKQIPDIADSIQIEDEKRKTFLGLEDARNPYHLVFVDRRMRCGSNGQAQAA